MDGQYLNFNGYNSRLEGKLVMVKKLFINIYSSPYVDMDKEDKIEKNIEPLPIRKETIIGATNIQSNNVARILIDLVIDTSPNQIIHVYEGDYIVYVDMLLQDIADFNKISFNVGNSEKLNMEYKDVSIKQAYHILIIHESLCDKLGLKQINKSEKLLSYEYSISNTGAAGECFFQIVGIVLKAADSFGGFPQTIEWFKYWFRTASNNKNKHKGMVFNEKKFYESFYKKHKVKYKDCVMTRLTTRKNKEGYKITLRYGEYTFYIKTDKISRIEEIESRNNKVFITR